MKEKSTIIKDKKSFSNRYAVIDLGTNTFSLIIVAHSAELGFKIVHREGRFVKLAEGGIEHIGEASFTRAVETMKAFREILLQYGVDKVEAFGTAALRTAKNSDALIDAIREASGIAVRVISGSEEAELIYRGVSQAVPLGEKKGLIMDIGGGSVEFIIANATGVLWAQSFPVGVAVLRNLFHHTEPMPKEEQERLNTFLEMKLQPLFEALDKHKIDDLIGASGTFDVLERKLPSAHKAPLHTAVSAADFYPLLKEVVEANYEERKEMKDIPTYRADMLVVSMLLIELVLEKIQVQHIIASPYAMKEGILQVMVER